MRYRVGVGALFRALLYLITRVASGSTGLPPEFVHGTELMCFALYLMFSFGDVCIETVKFVLVQISYASTK